MKVYELMQKLAEMPAGDEVFVSQGDVAATPLGRVETCDGFLELQGMGLEEE